MEKEDELNFKFGSLERLYGNGCSERLGRSHVCVVGLGGVGSWAVEGLARSGVGSITLVDFDDICISNFNRQIHAVDSSVGKLKTDVLEDRIFQINSYCKITKINATFNADSIEEVFFEKFDFVIDAIDDLKNKCILIKTCKDRGVPIVVCGGVGGRQNPWQIQFADLGNSFQDRLLYKTRKKLRQQMGFKKSSGKMNIPCVFSDEKPYFLDECGNATQEDKYKAAEPLTCSSGLGTSSFVCAAMGFSASAVVVKQILNEKKMITK
ncbi:MAG: tRNA threonylcarbamoyladenosine dehydratase [Bdellovibrionales bacterium]|nr:tRNA threonylcarbamoyladenosine dehydratase [Bdellovibrionales bacterium]